MSFNKKFINRFFRPAKNVVWDMMSGNIGIKNKEGIVTLELGEVDESKTELLDPQISINPFDNFGMTVPAFAQSVPKDQIKLGDMIFNSSSNKVLGWVVKKTDTSLKLMKQDGTRADWSPPKVNMIGFDSGVMVLRSLLTMLPSGESGLSQMQSSLMPMMAMGMLGDDSDDESESSGMNMKSMIPMMLMSQMGTIGGDSSGGGMNNMMQMMMMSQMMGDGKGSFLD